MHRSKTTGNLVIAHKSGLVVAANSMEVVGNNLEFVSGTSRCKSPLDDIRKVWVLESTPCIPSRVLAEHARLGATLLGLETALADYQRQTGGDPFLRNNGAVIFGSAAVCLCVHNERNSEDIDCVVSDAFIEWSNENWKVPTELGVDLADEGLFRLLGNWRNRATTTQGEKLSFQILHPLDVLMQKLLRRPAEKFETKDAADIDVILRAINPSQGTLWALLCENPSRYLADPSDHLEPNQQQACFRNTDWFLKKYLPGTSLEKIIEGAHETECLRLDRVGLLGARNIPERLGMKDTQWER